VWKRDQTAFVICVLCGFGICQLWRNQSIPRHPQNQHNDRSLYRPWRIRLRLLCIRCFVQPVVVCTFRYTTKHTMGVRGLWSFQRWLQHGDHFPIEHTTNAKRNRGLNSSCLHGHVWRRTTCQLMCVLNRNKFPLKGPLGSEFLARGHKTKLTWCWRHL